MASQAPRTSPAMDVKDDEADIHDIRGTTHAEVEAPMLQTERANQNWAWGVYTSAWTQIVLTSVVAFCLPGMYNALSGLGGGGNVDPHIAAKASTALTATAAASYLIICVPVFEIIGVRAMGLGGWTYALYSGSLLNFAIRGNGPFVVASGALLGLGSAFFWLVQGAVMISYPLPHEKGRAVATFWFIFNLGGMIGGFIAFGQNYGKNTTGTITNATYWAFIAIMLFGSVLSFMLVPPWKVFRSDGSCAGHNPALNQHEHESAGQKFVRIVKREILSVLSLRHEKRLFFLLPMFFGANWFYPYQQNLVNGLSFDIDGRSLNSALYWMAQMVGAFPMGLICDMPWFSRPKRAIIAWVFLFSFSMAIMGGGLAFENLREQNPPQWIKFNTSLYAKGATLYFFYGMLDSLWQSYSYWLLGAMCSTPQLAGKLVAVYKVTQCIGAAIANQLITDNVSSRSQFISNWAVIAAGLIFAIPAVLWITEPTEDEAHGGMTEGEQADMIDQDFRKTGEDDVHVV